jgi:ribonuclease-3
MAVDGALVAHFQSAVTKSPRAIARETLEARLGYAFKNPALLDQALTHISATTNGSTRSESYQRLEFLGDRVLDLVVAELLYAKFPDEEEGDLNQRLSELVRAETCADVAVEMDVGSAVKIAPSEARSGGRKKTALLADACEAVVAAVYLDGGYGPARALIEKFWQKHMLHPRRPPRDGKSVLQEWAASRGLGTPEYKQIERAGPDHDPVFRIEVTVKGFEPAVGEARAKRTAEKAAAIAFLTREGVWTKDAGHE